jgi:NAD(P)-dependent dehydrogenase (short-subunit alcohol dehydrogenase family)
MTNLWQGRRIVLTGASRGIGYQSARLFLSQGADVLGVARDEARLMKTALELQALGGTFTPLVADLSEGSAPKKIADAVAARWGALDLLINNAAVQAWKPGWHAEGLELFDEHFKVNVRAQHELIYRLAPLLKAGRQPRVVNVSSGAGSRQALQDSADGATYKFTKYALNALTILWAADLKGAVAVNSLDPGWLKTDLGGPNAPGEPEDGGRRMMEILGLPWAETGKFWHGAEAMAY